MIEDNTFNAPEYAVLVRRYAKYLGHLNFFKNKSLKKLNFNLSMLELLLTIKCGSTIIEI